VQVTNPIANDDVSSAAAVAVDFCAPSIADAQRWMNGLRRGYAARARARVCTLAVSYLTRACSVAVLGDHSHERACAVLLQPFEAQVSVRCRVSMCG
jgi:hypothetical protein